MQDDIKLTTTQLDHIRMIKRYGYVLVTEGPEYSAYSYGKRQINKSTFDALKRNKLIECIDKYHESFLICSVYKITEKGLMII